MTDEDGAKNERSRLEGRDVLAAARRVTMSSTLADLRKDWAGLDRKTQSRLETLLFRTPIVLAAVSLLLLGVMVSTLGGTVVHLVARTEYVHYTPLGNDPPQWLLKNATIASVVAMDELTGDDFFPPEGSTSKPADGVVAKAFEGFFQPRCGDAIVVSRIGTGPLHVRVSSDRDPIITDKVDGVPTFSRADLGRTFTITIPATGKDDAETGSSLVWPLEGRVDPGRAVGSQTTSAFGLLLEGRVEVVAGRVASNSTYTVDEHELELGDQVRLPTAYELDEIVARIAEQQAAIDAAPADGDRDVPTLCRAFDDSTTAGSTDKGFIHPDDGKGVNVSLSSNARYADIVRYRTAPIRVRSSWFKRLGEDRVIAFGWAVIGAVFLMYRKIARLIVIVAGEMKRKQEGADGR